MPRPDRALRQMIAQLSMLDGDDVAVILDGLSAQDRRTVEALLRECSEPLAVKSEPELPKTWDASRLSPWLVDILETGGNASGRARQVLRDSALRFYPALAPAPVKAAPPRSMARFVSLFSREDR